MLTISGMAERMMDAAPMSRMGITDDIEGRILVIAYMYDEFLNLLQAGKNHTHLAREIKDFYVLEVSSLFGKKYVHIEKDDTITLTSKPTFYIDAYLVETSRLGIVMEQYKYLWKNSNHFNQYGMFSLRKISYSERPVHLKD